MNKNINIAIVGIGNCTSALAQGIEYYGNKDYIEQMTGLMHPDIGCYKISDIEIVVAFDVDKRKIGLPLNKAVFQSPNNTKIFYPSLSLDSNDVNYPIVMKGPVLDGVADHMKSWFQVDNNQKELSRNEILSVLKDTKTDVLINYAPVGSQKLTEFWAQIALDSNIGFINAIPVFIASNEEWTNKFQNAGLPIIGDDVKSMAGSTITSRYLTQMLIDRGAKIDSIYQTNIGGNSDFANMTSQERLESKKISKTQSISCLIPDNKTYVYAGPNGCIDSLKDNKISYMRIDFKIFGNVGCSIDCKLSVEDSPNSGGVIVDAIRIMKIALDRGIGGSLIGPCAWLMKHPIRQYDDNIARKMVEDFINNKIHDK